MQTIPQQGHTSSNQIVNFEPPNPPSRDELIRLVRSFPYWYQRIYLGRGVYTLDSTALHEMVWQQFASMVPNGFQGASVLDVGTNAGHFCIQAKLLGAGEVTGIESTSGESKEIFLKQAEACRAIWNLDIHYTALDAHNVHQLSRSFDLIFFAGILYHLRHPFWVLEQLADMCNDAILVETEVISPRHENALYVRQGPMGEAKVTKCRSGFMKFIEHNELNGDPTNWWVPDVECVLGMLRTVGFKHFSEPRFLTETRMMVVATKRAQSLLKLR